MDTPSLSRREFSRSLLLASAGLALPSLRAAHHKVPVPSLGVQTDLANAAAVKAAGGSWIGLNVASWLDPDGPEAAFRARLEEAAASPLPIYACNSFIRRKDLKCNGPNANHDEVMEYVKRAFSRAERAGVKFITFGSSGSRRLPEGYDYQHALEQFTTLLQRMGPAAGDHGVTVQVEQLQKREVNFINRIGEMEQVVRDANHPNIRGVADFYHMVAEGDTAADLAKAVDIVSHVEIAELEGRRVPGTGGQDFRPYFKVLKESGYTGRIGIEGKYQLDELAGGFSTIAKQWNSA
ncbi:sugar phosphate isomerase/epimerase [Opitutaceae bacterium]|nr:sugar phosphate isomerase/epimerase [Opitutaceae bacterium]